MKTQQPHTLPEGWEMKRLGELGTWKGGGTPSTNNEAFWQDGSIPWVSPKDMKSILIDSAEDLITEAAVKQSSTSLIPINSILIVTRSGILRNTVPVAKNIRPVAINQDLKALILAPTIDENYVLNYLRSNN